MEKMYWPGSISTNTDSEECYWYQRSLSEALILSYYFSCSSCWHSNGLFSLCITVTVFVSLCQVFVGFLMPWWDVVEILVMKNGGIICRSINHYKAWGMSFTWAVDRRLEADFSADLRPQSHLEHGSQALWLPPWYLHPPRCSYSPREECPIRIHPRRLKKGRAEISWVPQAPTLWLDSLHRTLFNLYPASPLFILEVRTTTDLFSTRAGPSVTTSPRSTLTRARRWSLPTSKPTLSSIKLLPWKWRASMNTSKRLLRRRSGSGARGSRMRITACLRCPTCCRDRGETADEANYERQLALLDSKLDVYDGILSKQKYLAGNVCVYLTSNCVRQNKHIAEIHFPRKSPSLICTTFHTVPCLP